MSTKTTTTTTAGSRVTLVEGRSHVVTGYTPDGHSAYYRRNVAPANVMATVLQAEAAGWTHLNAGPESF
jgi:hypothetical protein